MTPGLRRDPARDDDVPSDLVLVEQIREEILAAGPITFARFMELALYDPERGYYRSADARPGREGDFLTAPETHPIFGRAIARQLDEIWRLLGEPSRFVVREHGAGGGALADAILGGLRSDASPLLDAIRYQPVEVDERRVDELRARVAASGFSGVVESPRGPVTGVVLANEVLDALPVHRVAWHDGRLAETYVGVDGERFVDVAGAPSTPALAARLEREGIVLAEGQRAEISLATDDWVRDAAADLERGVMLLIDYGYAAADLYSTRRAAGTLLAYRGHRAHTDVYASIGRQDITAHVDFTAVDNAARAAGLQPVGSTTQAELLVGLGIGDVLEAIRSDPATTAETYLPLRSALMRLLDPAATGGFRVVAYARGLPADVDLRGFSYRVPRPG
ncbi:MAG: class I SAM-dependent methyltransferase [Chloroflexota bacterium]